MLYIKLYTVLRNKLYINTKSTGGLKEKAKSITSKKKLFLAAYLLWSQ